MDSTGIAKQYRNTAQRRSAVFNSAYCTQYHVSPQLTALFLSLSLSLSLSPPLYTVHITVLYMYTVRTVQYSIGHSLQYDVLYVQCVYSTATVPLRVTVLYQNTPCIYCTYSTIQYSTVQYRYSMMRTILYCTLYWSSDGRYDYSTTTVRTVRFFNTVQYCTCNAVLQYSTVRTIHYIRYSIRYPTVRTVQ